MKAYFPRSPPCPPGPEQVPPRALYPGYFADRSHAIPRPLSFALLAKLKQLRLVDSRGRIAGEGRAGKARAGPTADSSPQAARSVGKRRTRAQQHINDIWMLPGRWHCLAKGALVLPLGRRCVGALPCCNAVTTVLAVCSRPLHPHHPPAAVDLKDSAWNAFRSYLGSNMRKEIAKLPVRCWHAGHPGNRLPALVISAGPCQRVPCCLRCALVTPSPHRSACLLDLGFSL